MNSFSLIHFFLTYTLYFTLSLIVISALIFITSTWSIMGNIFKIMIIFASIFLFFGISIVALNKFNLPNTAKTFFIWVFLIYLLL